MIGNTSSVGSAIGIASGYTKGSRSLSLSSSGVARNDWVAVVEDGDPRVPTTTTGDIGVCTWCGGPWGNGQGTELIAQFAQVTAVNGNTIGISRPLYWTYLADQHPSVKKISFSIERAGVEDLRLDGSYADRPAFISIEGALFSWVKGVETYDAGSAGNWDLKTNGVAEWGGGSDHALRASMYYGAQPTYFGSLSWPPYGYDRTPVIGALPAMMRFQGTAPTPAPAAPRNLQIRP